MMNYGEGLKQRRVRPDSHDVQVEDIEGAWSWTQILLFLGPVLVHGPSALFVSYNEFGVPSSWPNGPLRVKCKLLYSPHCSIKFHNCSDTKRYRINHQLLVFFLDVTESIISC